MRGRLKPAMTDRLGAMRPLQRPRSAAPLGIPVDALAGRYFDPGYGELTLCSLPLHNISAACHELGGVPFLFVNQTIGPALIARPNKFWAAYLVFHYYIDTTFTVVAYTRTETGAVVPFTWFEAVFVEGKGMGFIGDSWGAGVQVERPPIRDLERDAEVWFEKL
jgi:hypothetical protein